MNPRRMKSRGRNYSENISGSLKKSEPEFLAVGKLRRPFGLSGEMKVELYIDNLEVFDPNNEIFCGKKYTKRKIISFRESGKYFLIKFDKINNPEEAGHLTNEIIYLQSERFPSPKDGAYFYRQLLGLRVQNEDGTELGTISEIIETGANDVYVVFNEETQEEILIPAIKSAVLKIDIESNLMVVKQPEWFD